jgi:eukaryotic-like serine/threonine-protein kinase
MGEVYLAEDTRLRRKVALKILPAGLASDGEARHRFTQEARAASALNHPHIIAIYDIGSENGRDFIAMEYVDGEGLRGLLAREKLEVKRALELIAQAAAGLAAAHQANICHRDIKPDNLMVSRAVARHHPSGAPFRNRCEPAAAGADQRCSRQSVGQRCERTIPTRR